MRGITAIAAVAVALIAGLTAPASAAAGPGAGLANQRAAPHAVGTQAREPGSLPGRWTGGWAGGWGAGLGRWLPGNGPARLALGPAARPGWRPAVGSAAAQDTWRTQPTPNPVMPNGVLAAISCAGPARSPECTAVGWYEDDHGTAHGLAERWAGHAWAVQPVPDPVGAIWSYLSWVSCPTVASCTATGEYVSSSDQQLAFTARWDGARWTARRVAVPSGSTSSNLFGVSCASAVNCLAVGAYATKAGVTRALAEHWNGTAWAVQPVPVPAGGQQAELGAISCTAPKACAAVGAYLTGANELTLAERWDGSAWRVQSTPNAAGHQPSWLSGISCATATSCEAVGGYASPKFGGAPVVLAEAWNGMNWHLQTVPAPPPGPQSNPASEFLAVSCPAPAACTAVGVYLKYAGLAATLAERWNGTTWAIQATPNPTASIGSGLTGIACTTAKACYASGSYNLSTPISTVSGVPVPGLTLAEHWNGAKWAIQATRDRAGATGYSELNAVSCATPSPKSSTACAAVGDYVTSAGLFAPLAEHWNGRRWVSQPTPNPAATAETFLLAVSCPGSRACTAVGSTDTSGRTPNVVPLAEHWNGTGWLVQPVPLPAKSLGGELSAVSCAAASDCLAVGDYLKGSAPLAEQWNGTSWHVLTVPVPPATSASVLYAVSCTGPKACVAVGYHADAKGNSRALAETWNGSRWTIRAITSPPGAALHGLSCTSAKACTAVGWYIPSSTSNELPLAERWNGAKWASQPVPSATSYGDWLNAVACGSAGTCTAVGGAHSSLGGTGLLAETWTGSKWTLAPVANPANAYDSVLAGVAHADPKVIVAVGSYLALTNVTVTLAMSATD